jgi:putative transposase
LVVFGPQSLVEGAVRSRNVIGGEIVTSETSQLARHRAGRNQPSAVRRPGADLSVVTPVRQALQFALDPTVSQRRDLSRHAGAARYAYNWGLAEIKSAIESRQARGRTGNLPSAASLHRDWNIWKRSPEGIIWWTEVSKCAPQEAFRNLERGMHAYWASRRGTRRGPLVCFPQFKKKGRHDAFRLTGAIHLHSRSVTLPRVGTVRLCEDAARWVEGVRMGQVTISSATVSREVDRWFCSLAVEVERRIPEQNGRTDVIGVDLGVLGLATLSDGTRVAGPKTLGRGMRKLRRLSRAHSRKQKGSCNRAKAARRLARRYAKLVAIRRDHLHKLTTQLAKNHGRIVVNDPNIKGTLRYRGRARSLADAGVSEFRRQLAYKCQWYGSELIVSDRWFASSETCSCCGTAKVNPDQSVKERTYRCAGCGLCLDRDLNAAVNLAGWVHPEVAPSAWDTLNGCGEDPGPCAGPAVLREAATGTAPELTGSTGGPNSRLGRVASRRLVRNGMTTASNDSTDPTLRGSDSAPTAALVRP